MSTTQPATRPFHQSPKDDSPTHVQTANIYIQSFRPSVWKDIRASRAEEKVLRDRYLHEMTANNLADTKIRQALSTKQKNEKKNG